MRKKEESKKKRKIRMTKEGVSKGKVGEWSLPQSRIVV